MFLDAVMGCLFEVLLTSCESFCLMFRFCPSVTNVAVKSSPVNISGFNREIPVSMNQDVIFGCVMNRSKV